MVLGINTADDRALAQQLLKDKGVTFPNLHDTSMEASIALMAYETLGMSAVPVTYLIDPDGKVVDAWYGYQQGKVDEVLKKLKL